MVLMSEINYVSTGSVRKQEWTSCRCFEKQYLFCFTREGLQIQHAFFLGSTTLALAQRLQTHDILRLHSMHFPWARASVFLPSLGLRFCFVGVTCAPTPEDVDSGVGQVDAEVPPSNDRGDSRRGECLKPYRSRSFSISTSRSLRMRPINSWRCSWRCRGEGGSGSIRICEFDRTRINFYFLCNVGFTG